MSDLNPVSFLLLDRKEFKGKFENNRLPIESISEPRVPIDFTKSSNKNFDQYNDNPELKILKEQ